MQTKPVSKVIRTVIFLVVLAALVYLVSGLMSHGSTNISNLQRFKGFYEEREDSLDAVYIGASNVYTFWVAPIAWDHYGITVYPFSSSSQPLEAAEYLIREARKTQPDALYIVSINCIDRTYEDVETHGYLSSPVIHYTSDALPASATKFQMLQRLTDLAGIPQKERLEFYFPLLRYHGRWNELQKDDFFAGRSDRVKGAIINNTYLGHSEDTTGKFRATERHQALPDGLRESIERLLNYCSQEEVKLLFVTAPQAITDESLLGQFNTINDMAKAWGFPVLDMLDCMDELDLNPVVDYYNTNHTNLHGGVKVTDYLSRYLLENYGFEDKRDDPAYTSWNEAYETYVEKISGSLLDYEYEETSWDMTLTAPALSNISVNGTTLSFSWKAVGEADGYGIFRKPANGSWERIGTNDPNTLSYADETCVPGERYFYTVTAFRLENDSVVWGDHDFQGKNATALMNAPVLHAPSGETNNLTLTWDAVEGDSVYEIYRQVTTKNWVKIADVKQDTSYTDRSMIEHIPYFYRIRAYQKTGDEVLYSSFSDRVMWLPELETPQVTVTLEDGIPRLSWRALEWASGYDVYRRAEDGEWIQLTDSLSDTVTEVLDITAPQGEVAYRVTAWFTLNGVSYSASAETEVLQATAAPSRPLTAPAVVFSEVVGHAVQMVFEPGRGANAYRVYFRAAGEETWTLYQKSLNTNTFRHRPSAVGTYEYVIQSLYSDGQKVYIGPFQEDMAITVEFTG